MCLKHMTNITLKSIFNSILFLHYQYTDHHHLDFILICAIYKAITFFLTIDTIFGKYCEQHFGNFNISANYHQYYIEPEDFVESMQTPR